MTYLNTLKFEYAINDHCKVNANKMQSTVLGRIHCTNIRDIMVPKVKFSEKIEDLLVIDLARSIFGDESAIARLENNASKILLV